MTTQNAQHTPGPWTVYERQPIRIITKDETVIASVRMREPHTIANARLIADAPDLLAALEAAAYELEGAGGSWPLRIEARSGMSQTQ
jgi:hypothetical protein